MLIATTVSNPIIVFVALITFNISACCRGNRHSTEVTIHATVGRSNATGSRSSSRSCSVVAVSAAVGVVVVVVVVRAGGALGGLVVVVVVVAVAVAVVVVVLVVVVVVVVAVVAVVVVVILLAAIMGWRGTRSHACTFRAGGSLDASTLALSTSRTDRFCYS